VILRCHVNITLRANANKHYFFASYEWPSKLGCLSLANFYSLV
jgi:hypothetical protein